MTHDQGMTHRLCYGVSALFFIAMVFFAGASDVHAAFGVSPPFINADHLVKGSKFVQTIYLVQDNPAEDLRIVAELNINDRVKEWFVINDGGNLVIPKGTRQFPVTVQINVPDNIDLGLYTGTLSFRGVPAEAGQVTIALGVEVAINLTVGEGIFRQYTVPLIKFLDIEEGWSPRVYVKFNNEGNVPEAFDGATYELYDQFGAVRLAYVQKNKGFHETPPFTIDDYVIEFPIDLHLGLGQYWGNVAFFKEGKTVATQRTVFNVLERGSLSNPWASVLTFAKDNPLPIAGGGVVLLGALTFLARRIRRKSIA